MPSGPLNDSDRWRSRSEVMRILADEAQDPTMRAMMLRLAADYETLAKRADERRSASAKPRDSAQNTNS